MGIIPSDTDQLPRGVGETLRTASGATMRGFNYLFLGLFLLAGCKTGDKKTNADPDGRYPVAPTSKEKPKDPLTGGNHWLDSTSGASKDATPAAGTWANPNDPNYDLQSELRGQLAGFVEDPDGRKIGNAYVRIEPSNGGQAQPYGVYTTPDGSFLLPGLKPGISYTITVEARDQDRTLVGRAIAKAPNVRLRIPLMEGELPKGTKPAPAKPSKDPLTPAPTSAIPNTQEPLPPPLWQSGSSSRGQQDLPKAVPLEREGGVYPARGDLPNDGYSPADTNPGWSAPSIQDPLPQTRPELMTEKGQPGWKAPTATIPPAITPVPVPAPVFNPEKIESKKTLRGDQFQLVDALGRTRTFPAGRSGELVLLDFMTTNCIPCQKAIPALMTIQEKYAARGLDVVGVTCDDEPLKTRVVFADKYRKKYDLNYQIYAETGEHPGQLLKKFGVERYPTCVLLNSSGAVVWQGHPNKTAELIAKIEEQLQFSGR